MRYLRAAIVGVILLFFVFLSCGHGYGQEAQATAPEQTPPAAKAEEAPPAVTGTGTLGVFNKYIFRGYELSRRSVVVEPSLTASYQGFSATFWGNIDSRENGTQNFTPDTPKGTSFDETDLTLSYTYAIQKWSLTGGWIYYGTRYAPETQEAFGTVAYDMFLKPSLSIYRDIEKYPGTYFNLSIGHSFAVYKEVTLDLGASAGYEWGDSSYWKTYSPATGSRTGPEYRAFHDGKKFIQHSATTVYGIGEDGILAFTDFGIENLRELVKIYKDSPDQLKRPE